MIKQLLAFSAWTANRSRQKSLRPNLIGMLDLCGGCHQFRLISREMVERSRPRVWAILAVGTFA
jgi:hypothetical protein